MPFSSVKTCLVQQTNDSLKQSTEMFFKSFNAFVFVAVMFAVPSAFAIKFSSMSLSLMNLCIPLVIAQPLASFSKCETVKILR